MSNNDKIPIGKYRHLRAIGENFTDYIKIKLKDGVKPNIDDIITLDMIEPYESEAVRKVKEYISSFMYSPPGTDDTERRWIEHAREIVGLVHEAEDADE